VAISVIDLVKKFCPTAMVLMKDPTKLLLTLVKIGPALQTALRLDPKSLQGKANTVMATAGATAAKTQSEIAKNAASLTQKAQTAIIKQARIVFENYQKDLLKLAVASVAPVMAQVSKAKSKFDAVKKDAAKVVSISSKLMAVQKELKQAYYKSILTVRTKVPTGETSTIPGKVKTVTSFVKSIQDAIKRLEPLKKAITNAQKTLEQVKKDTAALKNMSGDIQALQTALRDVGTSISKIKIPPLPPIPPPKL
jgi:DNA repair exonuclease SbcCD ATPase subunit